MRRNKSVSYISGPFDLTVGAMFDPEGKVDAGGNQSQFLEVKGVLFETNSVFRALDNSISQRLRLLFRNSGRKLPCPLSGKKMSDPVFTTSQSDHERCEFQSANEVPSSCHRVKLPVSATEVAKRFGKQGTLPGGLLD